MKPIKTWLLGVLALVACPCHLPLWIALLVGTSAGAWLAQYQGPVFGIMTAIFAASGYLLHRRLQRGDEV